MKLPNLTIGEEEKEVVLERVRSSISFTGSTFWILVCAILIAAIGLNVNSTAVIIGAMLISPLMGPIVGAGFALGTYNFSLLRISLKNLLVATLVGLGTSWVYFLITPLKEAQPELLARTTPNIYDVLIAFIGGLVGVIAITRVEKGNPIPGVAIATALMPPLCTAGYGLAVGHYDYFAGALFLYTINCVFICIATFIIVKYLNYPPASQVDRKEEIRVRNGITLATLLLIVPSLYFAYRFVQKERFQEQVSRFITQEFEEKGNTVIFRKTFDQTNPRRVELAFLTRKFTAEEIREENKKMLAYGLTNTQLIIRQDSSFLSRAAKNPDNEVSLQTTQLATELSARKKTKGTEPENLFAEARAVLPGLQSLAITHPEELSSNQKTAGPAVALYRTNRAATAADQIRFAEWLRIRLNNDSLEIIQRPLAALPTKPAKDSLGRKPAASQK